MPGSRFNEVSFSEYKLDKVVGVKYSRPEAVSLLESLGVELVD